MNEEPIYLPKDSISPITVNAVNVASPDRAWDQSDLNNLAFRDYLYKRSQWLGMNTPGVFINANPETYYKDPEQVYNEVLQQTGDVSQAEKAKQDAITGNTNIDTNLKNWAAAKQYAIDATTPTEGIRDPGLNAMAVPLYGALGIAGLGSMGPLLAPLVPTTFSEATGMIGGWIGADAGGKIVDGIIRTTSDYDGWRDMISDKTESWKQDPALRHWRDPVINLTHPGELTGGMLGGAVGMLAGPVVKPYVVRPRNIRTLFQNEFISNNINPAKAKQYFSDNAFLTKITDNANNIVYERGADGMLRQNGKVVWGGIYNAPFSNSPIAQRIHTPRLPDNIVGSTYLGGNGVLIENVAQAPVSMNQSTLYPRGFTRYSPLRDYTYLSRLSQGDQIQLSMFSPREKFLANRVFKYLDREGLLKYYTNADGTLTFTPDEPILHLTSYKSPYIWDGPILGKRDVNWKAIEWLMLDKFRGKTIETWKKRGFVPYQELKNFTDFLASKDYYKRSYKGYDPEIKLPDLKNAWMDLDLELAGARMFNRAQNLARWERRVKWPMRSNNLTAEERIGIPKHERNLKKRPNTGENLDSDLLLYRVTDGHPSIVGGKIQHISSGPGFIRDNGNITFRRPMQNTLHWTSHDLVQSHMQGNWDDKNTVLINSIRNVAKENGYPISLEPMDTYFSTQTPVIPTEGLTVITNSPSAATMYKLMGARTFLNMRKPIVPSVGTRDFFRGLKPEHPYSYLWPYEHIPQTSDIRVMNSRMGISKPYDVDNRLGGYRNIKSPIEDYESIANQMDDAYLATSITSTDDGIHYEGLPKGHSAYPNGGFPLSGIRAFNWDLISTYYKKQYFDTLKRAINKGTIKISEAKKQEYLNDFENSSIYEYLVDAFGPYKKQ